jgi:hypothetical protein
MFISNLSLVNQKLAYAGATIDLLINPFRDECKLHSVLQQGLRESVVFHLNMALHFYVRELAEYHQVKLFADINSIEDLHRVLVEAGNVSLEATELMGLTKIPGTWVEQLVTYHNCLFNSPAKPREKKAFISESIIQATQLDDTPHLELSNEILQQWLSKFRDLVIRHREINAEY